MNAELEEFFKPLNHKYGKHLTYTGDRTYTGEGCAICGQDEAAHKALDVDKEALKISGLVTQLAE